MNCAPILVNKLEALETAGMRHLLFNSKLTRERKQQPTVFIEHYCFAKIHLSIKCAFESWRVIIKYAHLSILR